MTDAKTADLLKRAAVRLSRRYFEEVETERDNRWEGNVEEADTLRTEAEETRSLIEECREAADRLQDDAGTSLRNRARRSIGCASSRQAWTVSSVR